ncbi:MAG: Uma2 family endonuclease [Betaproteobacteria bacterium]|nr:Uma2 family endonuclease [Betaproteobacteria bacterium]
MNAPQRLIPNPLAEAAIEYGQSLKLDAPWETNAQGQIIMNPPIGFLHADRADKIMTAIKANLPSWRIWPELGLQTADGVKAPDLSAAPPDFAVNADGRGFLLRASVLCVEIMSPSNTWEEMRHKTLLYLAAGAKEVWVCDEDGALHFFDGSGELSQSFIAPQMPKHIG